ncbi:MAG: hypothetical protein ACRESS_06210 [Stenotrophobium sp.]
MRKIEILICSGLLLPLAAFAAGAPKIQCWTDEHGNRACGDQVPPQYAKVQRDVINSQGVTVQTEARQKTPEEIAQDERQAAEQKAQEEAAQKQAAYDRFLLQTYNSADDLKAARDLRLQAIDGRLKLAQKSVADSQNTLGGLHEQRDKILASGKQPNVAQLKQLHNFEHALTDNQQAVISLQAERVKVKTQFDQDIERYQQLKGETAGAEPAAR